MWFYEIGAARCSWTAPYSCISMRLEHHADAKLHTPARENVVGGVVRLAIFVDRAVATIDLLKFSYAKWGESPI